jgi:ubiquinone/menaquinone biosynthesis C-methylase UbiE
VSAGPARVERPEPRRHAAIVSEEMVRYYARRAAEYDRVYGTPRWQDDISTLQEIVSAVFSGRSVFEVACGTGYWTQHAARHAARVHATDLNEETLAIARSRTYRGGIVTFGAADAYSPAAESPRFDAGLAGLWLSHVDLARMDRFLAAFHSHLRPGAPVVMFDERDTGERHVPTSRRDEVGNRYEPRRLASGDRFEIIKNFFDGEQLRTLFGGRAVGFTHRELRCFWVLQYRVA